MTPALLLVSTLVLTAPPPGAAPAPTVVVATSARAVYLYWGRSPSGAVHQVSRAASGGELKEVARVAPEPDRERALAILRSHEDPTSRGLTLADDFQARADAARDMDAGLSLASPGWARLRGAAWLDETVEPGVTYRYRVVRLEADGAETELGAVEVVAGRPRPLTSPEPAPRADGSRVLVAFDAAAFTGYDVRRAEAPAGPYVSISPLPVAPAPWSRRVDVPDPGALLDGATVYYLMVPRDLLGREGTPSLPVPLRTDDRTAPKPPTRLTSRGVAGGIQLSWQASPGDDVAGYHLFRTELERTTDGERPLAGKRLRLTAALLPAEATSYQDRAARPGKVFHYEVTATDRRGNESPPSAPALATPQDFTPPPQVTGLVGAAGEDGVVKLSWAPSRAGSLWVYRVYSGVGEAGPLLLLESVRPTPGAREVTHLVKLDRRSQALHRFAVAAVSRSETEGPRSAEVVVRLPDHVPPVAPVITALVPRNGAMEVRWQDGGDRDVAGHHVYRGLPGQPVERVTAKPLAGDAASYADTGAKPGVAQAWSVSAVDRSGNEGPRSEARSGATFSTAARAAPTALTARPVKGGDRLRLEWRPAAGARGTMLYAAAARDGAWTQVGGLVTGASLVVPRRADAAFFRAQAVYPDGGSSSPTEPVEAARATRGSTP